MDGLSLLLEVSKELGKLRVDKDFQTNRQVLLGMELPSLIVLMKRNKILDRKLKKCSLSRAHGKKAESLFDQAFNNLFI